MSTMKTIACLILILSATAILISRFSYAATPGDLYVAETGGSSILKFDLAGNKSIVGQFSYPVGLAFDSAGYLYEGEDGPSSIGRIAPDGSQTTFASALSSPAGLAFDSSGNLFESDLGSGTIYKIAADGTKTPFVTSVAMPTGLAFDRAGNLYSGDESSGNVFKTIPSGETSVFASGMTFPAGLAFDSAGNLFVADITENLIKKFTPYGSATIFASGLDGPAGLAFDSAGNLFDVENRGGTILKFMPDGTQSTFASGLSYPSLIAFAPIPEKVLNLSARGYVSTADNVLIAGFILGGSSLNNNRVVVRALGASLTNSGIANALPDPTLEIRDSRGVVLAYNDNWQDTQKAELEAINPAPSQASESAILITVPAGNYTAIVRGAGRSVGVGLVEVYSAH